MEAADVIRCDLVASTTTTTTTKLHEVTAPTFDPHDPGAERPQTQSSEPTRTVCREPCAVSAALQLQSFITALSPRLHVLEINELLSELLTQL